MSLSPAATQEILKAGVQFQPGPGRNAPPFGERKQGKELLGRFESPISLRAAPQRPWNWMHKG